MSGFRSLISAIARSIRSGTKCGDPAVQVGELRDRQRHLRLTLEHPRPIATLVGVMPETPVFQAYCGSEPPRFANPAELEYAKVLDWYGIPWQYEPTTFVLERDEEGRVVEAFTPDFYLPDQDLYLEVTVMKQSLVTRKNRKLRKLRAALPGGEGQAVLRARLRTARRPVRAAEGVLSALARLAPSSTSASARSSSTRTRSGRACASSAPRSRATTRAGSRSLVGSLKACIPFVCDLSRANADPPRPRLHRAAGYGEDDEGIRFLKDLDTEIEGRDVAARRRGDRHGPDDALPRRVARRSASPARSQIATLFDRPTGGSSTTCRCAMSASRSPTSSSSATASSSTSATGTCRTAVVRHRRDCSFRGSRVLGPAKLG